MTKSGKKKLPAPNEGPTEEPLTAKEAKAEVDAAEAERRFGRTVAYGLPSVTMLGALGIGVASGLGPAILVLAAGAIVGTVSLLWASLRTLAGEAPLPAGVVDEVLHSSGLDALLAKKRMLLRALKDLENERALGKINDADFEEVAQRYRNQLKTLLREIDEDIAPLVKKADEWWKKNGAPSPSTSAKAAEPIDSTSEPDEADDDDSDDEGANAAPAPDRRVCTSCETSNEVDAAFCKKCGAKMGGESADAKESADAS